MIPEIGDLPKTAIVFFFQANITLLQEVYSLPSLQLLSLKERQKDE